MSLRPGDVAVYTPDEPFSSASIRAPLTGMGSHAINPTFRKFRYQPISMSSFARMCTTVPILALGSAANEVTGTRRYSRWYEAEPHAIKALGPGL